MNKKNIDLTNISDEELLSLRVCDLPLKIEGTWLFDCIKQLYSELEQKGIKFKPLCYLADEWLTPDGEPIVGIPFFLAHPVLVKLEKKMMLDAEGGTRAWCMRLLRHETGHAINYAYRLHRRKSWKKAFGEFSKEYEDTYRFRPYSKNFVRHLEDYYAQYHPDEDFAETFAVWLTPELDWQTKYKGWKALSKLKYIEEVMNDIKNKAPKVESGSKYWQASKMRVTLKNFYKKRQTSCAEDFPDFHDVNLKRIFKERKGEKGVKGAAEIIKKYRKDILKSVSKWTGEKKYIINDLLNTIVLRSRDLGLASIDDEQLMLVRITSYITVLINNYMYTGRFGGG